LSGAARGQATIDPQAIRFAASIDHDALDANQETVVSGYRLEIYRVDNPAERVIVFELGKPERDPDGQLTANVAALSSVVAAGEILTARVGVIGAGGVTFSNLSNPFVFSLGCTYTVNTASQRVAASGSTFSATVSTTSGCPWQAVSAVPWISVIDTAEVSGSGSVAYSVAPNTSELSRTGTLSIADRLISIVQEGQSAAPPPPANALPMVELTTPLDGAVMRAPATITLAASAYDPDGTIDRVDFYAGTSLIGTARLSPYVMTWADVRNGSYTLTAVAMDNAGGKVTSRPVSITVVRRKAR